MPHPSKESPVISPERDPDQPPASSLRTERKLLMPPLTALRVSKALTKWIGIRWGERFPMYFVSEHPKSGGTWLSRMVADCLQLPFPQLSVLPVACASVIQNMWTYDPRLRNVFYIYRDGRDVMVSLFFDRMRVIRHSKAAWRHRIRRKYERALGEELSGEKTLRLLPAFIEFEFKHPGRGVRANWRDHVMGWYDPANRPHVAYLSYEELLDDCGATLTRAIEHLTRSEIDEWRVEAAVEKFSMRRHSGRKPGQEDPTQHLRKGVAGDWVNHFTREAAELFNDLAGDALVALGYESDRNWVDCYNYRTV